MGSLIQTIVASVEFGLPELKVFCVQKLTNGITANNACTTLINLRSSLGSIPDENSLVEEIQMCCIEFIESNTRAVFKSKGFLQLPKEILLSIIRSSKVCTYMCKEEEEGRGVKREGRSKRRKGRRRRRRRRKL